jgi:hypothetical protein
MKYILSGALALGVVMTAQTSAFAWGCTAVARDGAYGHSYNYPNKRSAAARALAECGKRTSRNCRVVNCDPNG